MDSGSILGIAGVAGTLLFGALSIYFYFRPQTPPARLYWATRSSVPLLDRTAPVFGGLAVTVNGREIPQATIWTCNLWNGGKVAVRAEDVVDGVIVLRFSGTEVLGAAVVRESHPACRIQVTHSGSDARVSFRYLNKLDGGRIAVLHSGTAQLRPELQAAIVGGELHNGEAEPEKKSRAYFLLSLLFMLAGGALALAFTASGERFGLPQVVAMGFLLVSMALVRYSNRVWTHPPFQSKPTKSFQSN